VGIPEEDCHDLGTVFSPAVAAIVLGGICVSRSPDPWTIFLSMIGVVGGSLLTAFFFREWHRYFLAKR